MNVVNFPVFFLCDIFGTAVRIRVIFCSYGRKLPQTYQGFTFADSSKTTVINYIDRIKVVERFWKQYTAAKEHVRHLLTASSCKYSIT